MCQAKEKLKKRDTLHIKEWGFPKKITYLNWTEQWMIKKKKLTATLDQVKESKMKGNLRLLNCWKEGGGYNIKTIGERYIKEWEYS